MSIYFWSEHPWLAIATGIAFAVVWHARERSSAAIAALLWVVYGMYEFSMQSTCKGGCIRIDLLLILPILIGASIWAAIASLLPKPEESP